MTKEELANLIDGSEYGDDLSNYILVARKNGYVIVFGCSDDLIEFEGVICDEAGAHDGKKIYFNANGIIEDMSKNTITVFRNTKTDMNGNPASWVYETEIPCARFNIMEDNFVYCEGLIFSVNDLN